MSTPISKGYDRLAALMACDPGSSIYRSFAKLNAKNLLYLQAEIAYIQNDLQYIIEKDGQSEDKVSFPFSVWDMKTSEDPVQWEKVLEARRLLKEYSTSSIFLPFIFYLESHALYYYFQCFRLLLPFFPLQNLRKNFLIHHRCTRSAGGYIYNILAIIISYCQHCTNRI